MFEFSASDFLYSYNLVRPDQLAFTHVDYLPRHHQTPGGFQVWLTNQLSGQGVSDELKVTPIFASRFPGVFDLSGLVGGVMTEEPILT